MYIYTHTHTKNEFLTEQSLNDAHTLVANNHFPVCLSLSPLFWQSFTTDEEILKKEQILNHISNTTFYSLSPLEQIKSPSSPPTIPPPPPHRLTPQAFSTRAPLLPLPLPPTDCLSTLALCSA